MDLAARLARFGRKLASLFVGSAAGLEPSGWKAASPLVGSAAPRSAALKFAPDLQVLKTLAPGTPLRIARARKGAVFACPKLR